MLDIQQIIWKPKIEHYKDDNWVDHFVIKYLPRWFGYTLGNALRRVIIWYGQGGAITALKIKGISHEYTTIDGVKENVINLMLNFKKLRFKIDENLDKINWISQNFSKVGKYYAKDLKLPTGIEILNEDVYLFEITDSNIDLNIEYRIEKWYGYYSIEFLRKREEQADSKDIGLILIDNDFNIVDNINYKVEEVIEDFSWTMKDVLHVEIKLISNKVLLIDIDSKKKTWGCKKIFAKNG